jgi:hypothetical protein
MMVAWGWAGETPGGPRPTLGLGTAAERLELAGLAGTDRAAGCGAGQQYSPRRVHGRSLVYARRVSLAWFFNRWAMLCVIALAVATVCWKAFGWFESFGRVMLFAVGWSLAMSLWEVVRRRRRAQR